MSGAAHVTAAHAFHSTASDDYPSTQMLDADVVDRRLSIETVCESPTASTSEIVAERVELLPVTTAECCYLLLGARSCSYLCRHGVFVALGEATSNTSALSAASKRPGTALRDEPLATTAHVTPDLHFGRPM